MTYDVIRQAAKAEPFTPFFVCFEGGHRRHIREAEMIFVPGVPAWGFAIYEDGGYQIVDLAMVTALEFQYLDDPKTDAA